MGRLAFAFLLLDISAALFQGWGGTSCCGGSLPPKPCIHYDSSNLVPGCSSSSTIRLFFKSGLAGIFCNNYNMDISFHLVTFYPDACPIHTQERSPNISQPTSDLTHLSVFKHEYKLQNLSTWFLQKRILFKNWKELSGFERRMGIHEHLVCGMVNSPDRRLLVLSALHFGHFEDVIHGCGIYYLFYLCCRRSLSPY